MDLQLFAIDYTKYGDKGLRFSIRHNLEQIEKHRNKITHPEDYVTDYNSIGQGLFVIGKWKSLISGGKL